MKTSTKTALAALGCAVAVGACGGSRHSAGAGGNAQLAASQCMRAHGVPNFPDPRKSSSGSEGMTVLITPGSSAVTVAGIPFSGPAFLAAEKSCKFMGGGGGTPPQETESYQLAALHFARCMRAHGVPNYPDPAVPGGSGSQSGTGPQINKNAPAVVHAANACSKFQPTNGRGF